MTNKRKLLLLQIYFFYGFGWIMPTLIFLFLLITLLTFDFRWLIPVLPAVIGWSWQEGEIDQIKRELMKIMIWEIANYLQNNLHTAAKFEFRTWDNILVFSTLKNEKCFHAVRFNQVKFLLNTVKGDMIKRLSPDEYYMLSNRGTGILDIERMK